MNRSWSRLALACVVFFAVGCDPIHSHNVRKAQRRIEADRASTYESYLNEAREGGESPEDPRRVFQPNRLSGGLSDQAREIERDSFNIP
jgi:hypothetical protein